MKKTIKLSIFWAVLIAVITIIAFSRENGFFKKTPRLYKIGILVRGETYRPGVDGFISKMKELGYEEGKNISYSIRFTDKREELPALVSEMIKEGVDLIHVYSTPATIEVQKQTQTIPIVFGSMGDPLASKTVESLQRPGKNVTGVQSLSSPLAAKRLEFLKEAAPATRRVAFPFSPEDIPAKSSYDSALVAGRKLGVEIIPYYITKERNVSATASAIKRADVDGIVISSDSLVWANLSTYVDQAKKEKLPFAVFDKDMVERGGLLGYGPDYFITGEQSAVYADKILKGANPAELPIDSPRKLLLVLNRKTAREIGLVFPQTLLSKADLIIDESR
ncbi:MAG: ABC transporter substrate-binding protein [Candidatus Sungbacteria bacterium]|nr:ABC transporter substrate-binding protein [Candidatus Sungbacteria bacterium]